MTRAKKNSRDDREYRTYLRSQPVLTFREFADLRRVSVPRVHQWYDQGVVKCVARGRVDVATSIANINARPLRGPGSASVMLFDGNRDGDDHRRFHRRRLNPGKAKEFLPRHDYKIDYMLYEAYAAYRGITTKELADLHAAGFIIVGTGPLFYDHIDVEATDDSLDSLG